MEVKGDIDSSKTGQKKRHSNQYFVDLNQEEDKDDWTKRQMDDAENKAAEWWEERHKGGKRVMAKAQELKNPPKKGTTSLPGPGCRVSFLFRYCCFISSTRQRVQVGHTIASHMEPVSLFPYRT